MSPRRWNALLIFLSTVSNPAFAQERSCQGLCASGDPQCLLLPVPTAQGADVSGAAFQKLHADLADPEKDAIKPDELMSYFGVSEDPCGRSETLLSMRAPVSGNTSTIGQVFNAGEACQLSASVTLPSGYVFSTGLFIPEVLELDYQFDGVSFFIRPTPGSSFPAVLSDDADFLSSFGGFIVSVEFKESGAIIETSHGCLSLRFE